MDFKANREQGKTVIELQPPFSNHFKRGYLNTNKEPRRVLLLIRRIDGSKTSISYARYLMSCHLGRYLDKDEHVDHIDNNKMNDVIENLQILSSKDNAIKRNLALGIKLADAINLICPICLKSFSRPSGNILHKLKCGKTPCCSRRCAGIKSHAKK